MAMDKGKLALLAGPPAVAAVRGFIDSRYPEHGAKLANASKLLAFGGAIMAMRGGKHAMKFAWVSLVFSVPEGYTFGRDLAAR